MTKTKTTTIAEVSEVIFNAFAEALKLAEPILATSDIDTFADEAKRKKYIQKVNKGYEAEHAKIARAMRKALKEMSPEQLEALRIMHKPENLKAKMLLDQSIMQIQAKIGADAMLDEE
jgi:DNA integrity scanning protein DisA with diadenylate cyclase activity